MVHGDLRAELLGKGVMVHPLHAKVVIVDLSDLGVDVAGKLVHVLDIQELARLDFRAPAGAGAAEGDHGLRAADGSHVPSACSSKRHQCSTLNNQTLANDGSAH